MKQSKIIRTILAIISVGLLSSCTSMGAGIDEGTIEADAVFTGGKILTLSDHDDFETPFEAIAIKDGRVLQVGSNEEIESFVGSGTEVVDLDGGTVAPGINDSHIHLNWWATSMPPLTLDLSKENVSSIEEIRTLVEEAVSKAEPGQWIRGQGWDQGYLSEARYPHLDDIDDLTPDNPIAFTEWAGHVLWANSKALEVSGITAETKAPKGGEIMRDSDGRLTGILTEGAANLVRAKIPPFTDDESRLATIEGVKHLHALGITSITDPGVPVEALQMYADLLKSSEIKIRINGMISARTYEQLEGLEETIKEVQRLEADEEWLAVKQVKTSIDGVPHQAKTGWLTEEYLSGGHGGSILPGSTEEDQIKFLEEVVLKSQAAGFSVGAHATGDKAADVAIAAFENAANAENGDTARHYIIHGTLLSDSALSRLENGGWGLNFNPPIIGTLAHQLEEVLGRERADREWPFRSALDAGINVASSSDAPIVQPRFLDGIEGMLTRKGIATGEVYGKSEVISLEEALRTYTVAGAWQDRAEDWKGTLEPGMVADMVILGSDLLQTPPDEISEVEIRMTVINGEIVFDSSRGK